MPVNAGAGPLSRSAGSAARADAAHAISAVTARRTEIFIGAAAPWLGPDHVIQAKTRNNP